MRGGETKNMRRGVIKVMTSGVNEIEGGLGEERGGKGQQVCLFICCSISVIDLVFSHQPLGLSFTYTHMYTNICTHSKLIDCDCDMSVSNVSTTQWCFYDVVTPLTYFKVAQQESRVQFQTSQWQSSPLASTGYVNLFQERLGKFLNSWSRF